MIFFKKVHQNITISCGFAYFTCVDKCKVDASNYIFNMKKIICLIIFICPFLLAIAQQDTLPLKKAISNIVDTLRPDALTTTGKVVTGKAAVYDTDLDGTKTASGETFFNIRLTAASNDFKLNSWVKVTNPKNKKYVIVRINDRVSSKQKKKGIVINLSKEAGVGIGIKNNNLNQVKIEAIVINDSISVNHLNIDSLTGKTNPEVVDLLTPNSFKTTGKAITGIASFYSYNLDGTQTSTGEIYRNNKLTAASNNFKLNTWVLVINLRNKKSVIVRINDHMHPRMKKKGRVVDLSREAAKLLDFMDNGLTKVKVQPVQFVYVPKLKLEPDSLRTDSDSTKSIDSTGTGSVRNTEVLELTGIASFYSSNLDGTKTATGERYRNHKLSAASNNFNLNTWVRVTNLRNSKSVILRINDRMHPKMKKKGRIVDLSLAAAKKLDFIKSGLTKVKVEIVSKDEFE